MTSVLCALACAAIAAPASVAQEFDPQEAVDTVVGALNGGVQKPHDYICDENRPEVQEIVQGVKTALTTRYKNFASMSTWGYAPYADAPLLGLSGGQGHWLNSGFVEDGHIMDPMRPEGILVDKWNRPIGVMFINDQPSDPNDPSTWGPDMYVDEETGVPCNAWHYHTEILADSYWYAYKYAYSDDPKEGDLQPPNRTPDLMHVWAYGASGENYKYQWNHGTPPRDLMVEDAGWSADPGPQEMVEFHGAAPEEIGPGFRLPGMPPHP
jgi:hypothetical protein